MEASILDLRYKMKDVLQALDKREQVRILYHGKLKGIIQPVCHKGKTSITSHPFFGMDKGPSPSVPQIMDHLRSGRSHVV